MSCCAERFLRSTTENSGFVNIFLRVWDTIFWQCVRLVQLAPCDWVQLTLQQKNTMGKCVRVWKEMLSQRPDSLNK